MSVSAGHDGPTRHYRRKGWHIRRGNARVLKQGVAHWHVVELQS
jgi:hypothetical protein